MAAPTGAYIMRDAVVKFGTTDYANQCKKVRLIPSVTTQEYRTLVPDGIVSDIDTTWQLELTGLSDWETGGLARYFNDNAGSVIAVTFAPRKGDGLRQATCDVRIQPTPFGGEQGAFTEMDVTLSVVGVPTFEDQEV